MFGIWQMFKKKLTNCLLLFDQLTHFPLIGVHYSTSNKRHTVNEQPGSV